MSTQELQATRDGRGPIADILGRSLLRAKGIAAVALAAGVALLVATPAEGRPPIGFLAFPLLVWAALRFGSSRAAALTFTAGSVAIVAAAAGRGRPVSGSSAESVFLASAYLAVLASGALLVVALERSRARSEAQLREARDRLESQGAQYSEVVAVTAERLESEVAARRQAQDALLRNQRLSAGSPLSGAIAHQLNNPLTSIHMSATYALECEGDPRAWEIWQETLEEIEQQSERCGRIVHSLLQLARGQKIEMWVEDLNKLVREACELSQGQAGLRSASISCELCDGDTRVLANPVQIEQALLSLLQNAIASRESGAQVKVTVGRESDLLRISIFDDGDGIPAQRLEQVFEPHFTTRKASEGCGLGLGLARDIVRQHRGRLEIESTVGAGSHVMIELPAHRDGQALDAASKARS
jgi:signal transduction histidine kinase